MWVAVNIVTLASLLAALGYVAFAARKLDASLGALSQKQSESRRGLESHVERVRLESMRLLSQPHLAADLQQAVARHAEVDRR